MPIQGKLLKLNIDRELNVDNMINTTDLDISGTIYIENESFITNKKPTTTATIIDYSTYNNYDVVPMTLLDLTIVEYKELNKMNIVYFPDSDDTYDFTTLPAHKLTHILLGFGFPNYTDADRITAEAATPNPYSYDGDWDVNTAEGMLVFRYTDKFNANLGKLKYIKQRNPHLKLGLSLGGGKMSWNFSKVFADTTARTNFVNSIVGYIVMNGLDEINVDWEYPRFANHNYSLFNLDDDLTNYALFLTELRTLMNAASPTKYIPITVATGNYEGVINDFIGMNALIDYYYVMTYDYSGTTWNEANPQTAVEDTGMGDNKWVRASASLMNTVAKIPKDKILIGAASYGYGWSIVNMLGTTGYYGDVDDPITPTLPDDFSGNSATGVEFYKNIVNERDTNVDYSEVIDSYNSVDFGVHLEKDNLDGTHEIWTYDNEYTVGLKAQLVNDVDYAGMINWNLTGDTTDETSLVNAAYEKFLEIDNFYVSVLGNNNDKISINKQGWLGLGVQNPQEKLDVEGGINCSGDMAVVGDLNLTGSLIPTTGMFKLSAMTPSFVLENQDETSTLLTFQDESAPATQAFHLDWHAGSTDLTIRSDTNTCLYLRENGMVGIGDKWDKDTLPTKILQIDSITSGIVPPIMTTTQRNAITPTTGELLFNTSTAKLQCYDGSVWKDCWA